MICASRDSGNATGETADINQCITACSRAIPQLAVIVPPPAFDSSTRRQRTGMLVTRRDSGNATAEAADIYRRSAACGRAVPQMADIISTPAFDPPTLRQRTGVIAASRDSCHATVEAADIHRCSDSVVCGRAIPKFAVIIATPAFDPSTLRQRTGVRPDVNARTAIRDNGHATAETIDIYRCSAVCGRAIPQLAVIIATPTFAPPLSVSAQVCSLRAEIAETPLLRPLTSTGVVRSLRVPSPSWP